MFTGVGLLATIFCRASLIPTERLCRGLFLQPPLFYIINIQIQILNPGLSEENSQKQHAALQLPSELALL